MKRLALASVQNTLNIQQTDVQNQNFGITRIVNANVRLVYQRVVVDHHKDGLTLNVAANVIPECQKVVVQEIKTGLKMLVHAYVQRKFQQMDAQAVRNGSMKSAVANVHMQRLNAQEINNGMTLFAVASASHQQLLKDVLEINNGIMRNAHVNVVTRENVTELNAGMTMIAHVNVQMKKSLVSVLHQRDGIHMTAVVNVLTENQNMDVQVIKFGTKKHANVNVRLQCHQRDVDIKSGMKLHAHVDVTHQSQDMDAAKDLNGMMFSALVDVRMKNPSNVLDVKFGVKSTVNAYAIHNQNMHALDLNTGIVFVVDVNASLENQKKDVHIVRNGMKRNANANVHQNFVKNVSEIRNSTSSTANVNVLTSVDAMANKFGMIEHAHVYVQTSTVLKLPALDLKSGVTQNVVAFVNQANLNVVLERNNSGQTHLVHVRVN